MMAKARTLRNKYRSPSKYLESDLAVPKRDDRPDIFQISAENLWSQYGIKQDRLPKNYVFKRAQSAKKLRRRLTREGTSYDKTLDMKVYEYPTIEHNKDFTQKLITMKEKVDQFHLYFYSKTPYFLNEKKISKKIGEPKPKLLRRNSVMPGSVNYNLLNMVSMKSSNLRSSPEKIRVMPLSTLSTVNIPHPDL